MTERPPSRSHRPEGRPTTDVSPGDRTASDDPTEIADDLRVEPETAGSAQAAATGVGARDLPPVVGGGTLTAGSGKARPGDRIFRGLSSSASLFTVLLIALIAIFLASRAFPSILHDKVNFLTSRQWLVEGTNLRFGIVDLLYTTVLSSLLAMLIALPVSIGIALFITQYAPRRLAGLVGSVVDLLAAVPSIVYGVWGILVLAPKLEPVQRGLYHLGAVPLFKDQGLGTGTVFDAGIVLAIMILPIITAVSRDVFERTPGAHIEAAWALGATRWEMIRMAVLPHGRPGVVSGAMLGLGRALGETIAVLLILSTRGDGAPFTASLFAGGETFASKIANAAPEFNTPSQTGAYIAAGLVLFVLTFVVNAAARAVVNRGSRS